MQYFKSVKEICPGCKGKPSFDGLTLFCRRCQGDGKVVKHYEITPWILFGLLFLLLLLGFLIGKG